MKNRGIHGPTIAAITAALILAPPTAGAQDINRRLADLDLGIVAVTIDMADGQFVGERAVPDGRRGIQTFRWDVEVTPDDRVSDDELLGVEHFRFAGLPVEPGTTVSFTEGLFGRERFRLGGRLTSLNIKGADRIEVRTEVVWSIYDTESGEVIAELKSKGLAKGTVLGTRGEQPNALMDSVIHSLEEFLEDEGEDAIKDAQ
jgi:hypothetical protein